ncbi:MAG TPA: hypothetical protein VGE01_01155 [Fimbriimonas sp.]
MLASLAVCAIAFSSMQTYRQRYPLPDLTVPNGWGVNIHFNDPQPGEMEKLAAAGFRWIRQDLSWGGVEREKGTYDFEPLARLFDACDRHGIRPLIILDYGNDLYEKGAPKTPESRAAFCRMVEALMGRFKGRGALWEMWNEPNIFFWQPKANVEEYIPLAAEVGETIRRVAPEEYYVGPATSGFDWSFLERCFQAGLLKYWDAVTVHPYRQTEPETALPDWGRLRSLIDRYQPKGKRVPMLSGEWGYSELYSAMNKERQGHFIARQYLANLMAGVGLSIWYDWKDDGTDPKEVEHHFGTLYPDLRPKPAYEAASALASGLQGYTYHLRLAQRSPDDFLLAFRNKGNVKYVGWTLGKSPSRVVLPHGETWVVDPAPKVVEAPKGAARDLVLAWSALPPSVSVGSDQEARQATSRLKQNLPKGALVQMPTLRDAPDVRGQRIKVRVAKGPVAIEQETLVVQPKPLTMNLFVQGAKLYVAVENPGGRQVDGTLGIRQGTVKVEKALLLAPEDSLLLVGTNLGPTADPVNVTLVDRPISPADAARAFRTFGRIEGAKVRVVPIGESELALVDDGDPKLKGTYRTRFEEEARVAYEFPLGWKFFMLRPTGEGAKPLPGKPTSLNLMVWGDGSGDLLRMRFTDATGQTFQPDYGPIHWKGWRPVSFPLSEAASGRWGGANDGAIHYPIHIDALVLVDSYAGRGGKGEIAVRDAAVLYR